MREGSWVQAGAVCSLIVPPGALWPSHLLIILGHGGWCRVDSGEMQTDTAPPPRTDGDAGQESGRKTWSIRVQSLLRLSALAEMGSRGGGQGPVGRSVLSPAVYEPESPARCSSRLVAGRTALTWESLSLLKPGQDATLLL